MKMSLFKKNSEIYTRFKVKITEFNFWVAILEIKYCVNTNEPVRQNSRFIYFEKEGDWINGILQNRMPIR